MVLNHHIDSANIYLVYVCVCVLSRVWLFATPWTIAYWAPLSMGLPKQEYWSGVPFPSPGDLPDPGSEPKSLASPASAGGFITTAPPGKMCLLSSSLKTRAVMAKPARTQAWKLLLTLPLVLLNKNVRLSCSCYAAMNQGTGNMKRPNAATDAAHPLGAELLAVLLFSLGEVLRKLWHSEATG